MLKIKKIFFILLIVSCYFVIEGFFIPGIGNIGNDIIGGWIGIINDRKIELNAVSSVPNNDAVKDWDNNLTTQIVNKNFKFYILSKRNNNSASVNITKVVFYYYNDGNNTECNGSSYDNYTVCDDSTSNSCPDTNSSGEIELNTTISQAVKCIQVYIEAKKGWNNYENNSTDDFAIRPYKFIIDNIPNNIISGKDFNITLKAVDYNNNAAKDYNESIYITNENKSVELNWSDNNPNCITGQLEKIAGKNNFENGEVNLTLNYNEVGNLKLILKENNGSEFAKVDNDDTNLTTRIIETNITILPSYVSHFDKNATMINYNNDYNFTYYNNDLNITGLIELNITAKNDKNITVKNYNNQCYAKNLEINISMKHVCNGILGVSNIIYYYIDKQGNKNGNYKVQLTKPLIINYDKINFTTDNNGSTWLKIYFNLDRNASLYSSPINFKVNEINISNSNMIDTNQKFSTKEGNITFYYGSIYEEDLITTKAENNATLNILIYDNNSSDNLNNLDEKYEELINLYLNIYHELKDGNLTNSDIVFSKDFNSSDKYNNDDFKINSINYKDGKFYIDFSRKNSNIKFVVIHIMSKNFKWLWYNRYTEKYDVSDGSTCLNHYCIEVTYETNNTTGSVESGVFNGTKAKISPSSTVKAPRIYR